ncbi:hypothetical protein M9Y10_029962 [Tritrichomonas musculus]|uniref:Peptidase M60 domain-containing protein n=1 Tax=Tritrichomonas musculus TaxID=1915356 RepID=A0ABR2KNT0_9EUKA
MLFLLSSLVFSVTDIITDSDKLYSKSYKCIGRVGYFFEYLGEVARAPKPELKSENILPADRLPLFDQDPHLTPEEQDLVLEESRYITANTTQKLKGTYDIFDKDGYLYLKGEKVKYSNGSDRKLYKHLAAVGNFLGNVSDDEPAIKKRLTYRPRHNVFSITGLYAPPGEPISVRISKNDLQRIGQLYVSIGPILNNGDANNEWKGGPGFPRMPIIANLFKLSPSLKPVYEEGDDYIFYIGSFLGGPIYIKNKDSTIYDFTVIISGAVRYWHYVLGYTTPEEFLENKKSSSPYFDLEIWQNGIMHSGPRKMVETLDYDACYDAAIYWQKVTSVSSQVPDGFPASISVNMMYEPFIAAGGAVAFGSRATTNCPLYWFAYSTSYKDCLQDSSCDTWGPHHEYHHHFQRDYGIPNDGETSNNLVTLISYSLFSKVSQRRSEESEPTGDSWNLYTSASWVLNKATNNVLDYHLSFFAIFLHCFGQDMLIKAVNKEKGKSLELWYSTWTNITELDFTYFIRNVYNTTQFNLQQTEVDKYKDKNFKNFIPIACRYQTGIGYKIKGKYNWMRTMYPFLIKKGENKLLNFTKQMVVPRGFSYTIKSFTNPEHGTLTKQSENVYVYSPDEDNVLSGEMTFTIGLKKDNDPNFAIDDIQIYVELQQTGTLVEKDGKGRDKLDRTIYTFPYIPDDPIAEYNSGFKNATSQVTILNNATQGGLNTQIMVTSAINPQNRISVLQGKFEVQAGKYRIALMCRNLGVLYLSYDGGKTYELGCKVLFECADERYYTDHEEIFVHKEFAAPQWVYFKFVVCHKMQNTARRLFSKIGLDKYDDNGEVSSSVTDLTSARSIRYEADPIFYSKDFYPKVWSQTRTTQYPIKGTLLASNYVKYPDPNFNIENLFDDDDTNIIHTNGGFVTDTNPFMILVDLGKEIQANKMTIYGATQGQWQYQPTHFKLYAGVDKDDLKLIYEVAGAEVRNHNVEATFESQTIRYYQLNVTNGKGGDPKRFVVFRYLQFSNEYKGTLVSMDDDRVTLYNGWKKVVSPISTFGNSYESDGESSKVVFKFTGTGLAINSRKSQGYGTYHVHVDGVLRDIIDLNGEPNDNGPCVCTIKNLPEGEHEVILQGASSSSKYNVDSFMILQGDDLKSTSEELPVSMPPTPRPEPTLPPTESPSQSPHPTETPTPTPVIKTPEPHEIEEIKPDENGVIDTTHIPSNSQTEYESEVVTDKIQIIGNGSENLYISINNNNQVVDVAQTDAKFGIKLDSENNAASIKVNQENIQMNVKGSGTLNIDANNNIEEITVNEITVSHTEKMNINIKQQLKNIAFNNLNMFGESALNMAFDAASKRAAKVKTVTINEGAESTIKNVDVTNKIDIGLNAAMSLNNVDLSGASNLNIAYSPSLQYRVPITGKIGKPPVSISLLSAQKSLNYDSLLEEQKFTIASSAKDDFPDCDSWIKPVSLDGTGFNKVECRTENNNRQLVAFTSSQEEGGKKSSSKTGIIIGVVVAVIVVIVIIVVVVVVVKRKNKFANSSDDAL